MKNRPISTGTTMAKAQSGVMLLEALIGILIFSLGILTVMALQAASVRLTGDAKYRTDATLLANQLIGQMWASGTTLAALQTDFQTGGASYNTWLANDVQDAQNGLPGAVAPQVVVGPPALQPGQVVITLFWRTPDMAAIQPSHQHIVTAQIVF